MADSSLTRLSVAELGQRIRAKDVSPVEVAQAFLARVEATEPTLNAFITPTPERALADARQAEQEIAAGNYRGPLHGIPIALKDLYWTAGIRTTSGSAVDADFVPSEDSAAAARLAAAGTTLVGKTNMVEFAFGGMEHNDLYGPPQNPWKLGHITGGSSSGSASAVAAGQVPLALGTDTAASIRTPAAFCGISGHKPTYGLVSRYGVTSLAYSLDHVGPMARTVEDLAIALNALAGHDPRDGASVPRPAQDYAQGLGAGVRGLKVGVPRHFISAMIDPEVEAAFDAALTQFGELGADVEEVTITELDWSGLIGSATTPVEAAAFHGDRILSEGPRYHPGVRRRIETGRFVPAATYVRAQRLRALYTARMAQVFERYDVLAMPTVPVTAQRIGEVLTQVGGQPLPAGPAGNIQVRMTQPFNVNGSPSVSVPAGFSDDGLPIGLQISGKPWDDALVLRVGNAYQQATDWHNRWPDL